MSKFAPNLTDVTQPLRELLVKGNHWVWGEAQQSAIHRIKKILTSSPVLALFDLNVETIVSADASSLVSELFCYRDSLLESSSLWHYIKVHDTHIAEIRLN